MPIKFWVYRRSNGTGGPTLQNLKDYIDNLNHFYNVENNTWIGFYMACQIGYIDDDSHTSVETWVEARELNRDHRDDGCINVHIANQIEGGNNGIWYPPRLHGSFIFISSATYNSLDLISTLSHEVGHYFTLEHTHEGYDGNNCNQEPVDRDRTYPTFHLCISAWFSGKRICEVAGDGLDDTPADPELSHNTTCSFNSNSNYYTNKTDNWGDHYFRTSPTDRYPLPDTRNIMNYNWQRSCRIHFTRKQIACMLYDASTSRHADFWENTYNLYDSYEPDNFPQMASVIKFGEIQERSFHKTYVEDRSFGYSNKYFTQCDEDWMTFKPTCTRSLTINTFEVYNRTKANTRITLYDNDGTTVLAQK